MKPDQTIRELHAEWWRRCGPEDAPPLQVEGCRDSFYSGAAAMLITVRDLLNDPTVTDQKMKAFFGDRVAEVSRYYQGRTAGRN